jgi:hypothetical protein
MYINVEPHVEMIHIYFQNSKYDNWLCDILSLRQLR